MIRLYGSPRSSAGRCYLVLEELGLPYEVMSLDMMGKREHKSEAYLKLNPNGKVPCLSDGDFVIWESMAITWYLADKYRPALLGATPEMRGLVQQWSYWAITELQPPMVDMLIQLFFTPEDKRDHGAIAKAKDRVPPRLAILDNALRGNSYLVGETLTVADLNVASVVNIAGGLGLTLDGLPHLTAWFEKIKARPSFQVFIAKRQ
ncbi:MAG: glutathione S-transferase family protein [Bdellovibrionaceae bacterium]|nr:glutathione S-transferase family protein [Pseudobdellovibrionaceae bacterium]